MASTPQATVGVWAGRPDGTASPGLTGRDTAGPVLAALLSLLSSPPHTSAPPASAQPHRAVAVLSPALRSLQQRQAPQIIFPRNHSEIESSSSEGTMLPVGLEGSGGHPPYHWYINGIPLDVPPGAQPSWTPDAPGFAISLLQMRKTPMRLLIFAYGRMEPSCSVNLFGYNLERQYIIDNSQKRVSIKHPNHNRKSEK